MMHEAANVWNTCLKIIAEHISKQSYETWFKPIKALDLKAKTLNIQVPNQFFYEWLEEYYLDILKKAIKQTLGEKGRLQYSILVGQKAPPKPTKPKSELDFEADSQRLPWQTTDLNKLENSRKVSQLIDYLCFENFIEGKFNRLARSAGLAIAEKPGSTSFNPFFLYSEVGLGKTHLIQAIGNRILQKHPDKFVLYITAEQFANQFITSLQRKCIQQFTHYYQQVDVFLIDDVQFLCRKEKTQESFFHIFNYLHQNGKQIVMTSDQAPKDLKGVQERLLSRFKWGLTTDIKPPGVESRKIIIKSKIELQDISISEDLIDYLANHIDSNIREMEGILVSMIANAAMVKRNLDLNLAKAILEDALLTTEDSSETSIEVIQNTVCDYFGISIEDLNSKSRKRQVAMARQIAMYLSHQKTNTPLKTIGKKFGGRDHSTVIHANRAVKAKQAKDETYKKILEELKHQIKVV